MLRGTKRVASGRLGFGLAVAAATLLVGCGIGGGGGGGSRTIGGTQGGTGTGTGTAQDAPTNLQATALTSGGVELTWTDNSLSEDGFRIERAKSPLRLFNEVGRVGRDQQRFTDNGLKPQTTYIYRVAAFARGTDIGMSTEVSVTTQGCGWTTQVGTATDDVYRGVAHDATNGQTIVAAYSDTGLGGTTSAGSFDAYIQAFDASGQVVWTTQLGSAGDDRAVAVAVDAAGDTYVAGFSDGDLGAGNAGSRDAFLAKLDVAGKLVWIKSYGTSSEERGLAVAIDGAGDIVLGGMVIMGTQDPFMVKYDANGTQKWVWTTGTRYNETLNDVAIDPSTGDAYCIGRSQVMMPGVIGTPPNAPNYIAVGDIFVAKVDSQGNEQWIVQVGSPLAAAGTTVQGGGHDLPGGVTVTESGDVYVCGFAQGDADGIGSYLGPATDPIRQDWSKWGDAVLFKLDTQGALVWTKQFGTPESDWAFDVQTTQSGKVYVTGFTKGDMTGTGQNAGGVDLFVAAFSSTGTQEWIKQFGTTGDDWAYTIATDGQHQLFTVGYASEDLDGTGPGTYAGGKDGFLMQLCD